MPNYEKKYKKLKQKVDAWIAAEFHFRQGAHGVCHSPMTTEWYLEAEDDLREATSKCRSLVAAAHSLGVKPIKVVNDRKKRKTGTRPKLKARAKLPRKKVRKIKGIFDE